MPQKNGYKQAAYEANNFMNDINAASLKTREEVRRLKDEYILKNKVEENLCHDGRVFLKDFGETAWLSAEAKKYSDSSAVVIPYNAEASIGKIHLNKLLAVLMSQIEYQAGKIDQLIVSIDSAATMICEEAKFFSVSSSDSQHNTVIKEIVKPIVEIEGQGVLSEIPFNKPEPPAGRSRSNSAKSETQGLLDTI